MAHRLDNPNLHVHQALHGYSDGHRMLACSTVLKTRDQKTMLIMSDVSGPNAVIGDGGYITGYPLPESGVYALARTWAATEMTRPGCVWTHTLLLDFADLAVVPTMDFLLNAFRRPTGGLSSGSFETPMNIEAKGSVARLSEINQESLKRIVYALYEYPKDRIIASSDDSSVASVFLLWAQQWPRLRRSFRFCTLAYGDRSGERSAFDLQFIPTRDRSVRSRFSELTDADRIRPRSVEWIDTAISDLFDGRGSTLRKFLREVGGDLAGGREAFVPLCRLYQLTQQFADREDSIDEAVQLLDNSFDAASANSLRTTFVSAIAKHPAGMGKRAIDFLLTHLDLLDADGLQRSAVDIAHSIWNREPEALVRLLNDSPPRPLVADEGLAQLSIADLIHGLQRNPQIIPAVLRRRPELSEERDLWMIKGSWWQDGMIVAANDSARSEAALSAMLAANRNDLASAAVHIFGCTKVLMATYKWASGTTIQTENETIAAWLTASVNDGEALADVFSKNWVSDRAFLSLIARMTYPDLVPNSYGEDPWWTSVNHAKDNLDDAQRQYLAAYLLARALGHRSRNQAELIQFAFDDVYIPASQSRLSAEAWKVIEPRLPKPWFFDWDYCRKMRDALVDAFVEGGLSPETFTRVTRDDEVFGELTRALAQTGRGRRFLKKALQVLMNQNQWSKRIEIIQEAV